MKTFESRKLVVHKICRSCLHWEVTYKQNKSRQWYYCIHQRKRYLSRRSSKAQFKSYWFYGNTNARKQEENKNARLKISKSTYELHIKPNASSLNMVEIKNTYLLKYFLKKKSKVKSMITKKSSIDNELCSWRKCIKINVRWMC